MSTEKKFTVVGTTTQPDGTVKVRWANDLVARIKILDKAKCPEIDLIELPSPMTKLDAAQYFLDNKANLSPGQCEILEIKIAEKSRTTKRATMKTTLTKNVKTRIKDKAPTDPAVEKFIAANTEKVPAK